MSKVNETFLNSLPAQNHIYYNTYFRIEAGYVWGSGMSKEDTLCFFEEMKQLFSKAGWSVEESGSSSGCPTVHKGGNHLYCHPMQLSGPCEPSLRPEVERLLTGAETCFLRSFDTYSQVYDVTDEQYQSALEAARKDIAADLMQAFRTEHKHQYIQGYYSIVDEVAEHYRVPTLDRSSGVICSDDVHIRYITGVFQDLTKEGKILYRESDRGGKQYRAATGPELLELARRQAANLNTKIQGAQDRIQDKAEPIRPSELKFRPTDRGFE